MAHFIEANLEIGFEVTTGWQLATPSSAYGPLELLEQSEHRLEKLADIPDGVTSEQAFVTLRDAFVPLSHLREAAVSHDPSAEAAIAKLLQEDPVVQLARDVGILAKHQSVTHPFSSVAPKWGALQVSQDGTGPRRFTAEVMHGSELWDAVELARGAIAKVRRAIKETAP